MNSRKLLFRIPIAAALIFFSSLAAYGDSTTSINLIPMYGYPKIEKTDTQKEADERFIKTAIANSGSRENASKEFAAEAWRERRKGDAANAMRRFNQAWLLNPNYYQPYWGFGALLLAEGKAADAATHYEKASALVDVDQERPRLLTDTARAYSILGSRSTDKKNAKDSFEKANSLFSQALMLDAQYANAYHAWAFSLYHQSNYGKSWDMVKKSRSFGRDFDPIFIDALSQKMPEQN